MISQLHKIEIYDLNMWNTYVLTISQFGNSWQNQNKQMRYKRSHKQNFDNLYFWNTLNKTHQCIFVWNKNNRLYTRNKKHVHKERKETIHVKLGEEDIHHHTHTHTHIFIYIYICIYIKDKHNVCKHGHKTSVQEEAERISYNNKEVNTLPNRMKHNSPLQGHVFLCLTCRILKWNNIFSNFSPFLSWLTNGTRS